MWQAISEFFGKDPIFTTGMMVFLLLSLVIRMALGTMYKRLIEEADNMATTNHRALRQWKVKYENCYQMNKGVSNTAIFVDKLISRLTWGPLTYGQWYLVSAQLMLLSVLAAGIGICRSLMGGGTVGEILPYYILIFTGLYMFISVTTSVDIREKRRILKVNMIDYLENHLSSRIQVTKEDLEYLYGEQEDPEYELIKKPTAQKEKRAVEWKKRSQGGEPASKDSITYDELERLLRELLAT